MVVQFRAERGVHAEAQQRLEKLGMNLPDVMRAAHLSVSQGDVTHFANLFVESVEGAEEAWLYQKCHETFAYAAGRLLRKARKGNSEAGSEVVTRLRNNEPCVILGGKWIPVKDVVWLMNNGTISGEVIYKNPHRISNKDAIENLMINPVKVSAVVITKYLTGSERIAICSGKQRALVINTVDDKKCAGAIERLINRGETIRVLLRGRDGEREWSAARTAIHAIKLSDDNYVLSIS